MKSFTQLDFVLANLDKIDFDKVADFMVKTPNSEFYKTTDGRYIHLVQGVAEVLDTAQAVFCCYDGLYDENGDTIIIHIIKHCIDYT